MTPIQIVTTRTGIALTPFVYFLSVSFESRTETPDSIANCSPLSLSTKQLRFQFRPNLIGFFVNLKTLQGISVFYIASSVLLHHISSDSSVLVSFVFPSVWLPVQSSNTWKARCFKMMGHLL
ncbi:unnamed protein product [Lactuca virosa]|uniref:Uncharacterized protein n=1 Tax=Lactuca virosa TaxID=75947 RepID=A0AAU9MUJ3_9ASTR|nr:unnamed protein product [Lactuca virosa]